MMLEALGQGKVFCWATWVANLIAFSARSHQSVRGILVDLEVLHHRDADLVELRVGEVGARG
jgi:hypothetical protein